MSQQNGQRARFQINRKRRVVRNMRLRSMMAALKQRPEAGEPAAAAAAPATRRGPALKTK